MKIKNIFLILAVLLMIACGSDDDSADKGKSATNETARVLGLHLQYTIQVNNIPLTGPQSELVDLYLTATAARSEGIVEVTVVDEVKKNKRISILNYADNSRIIINPDDSTYQIEFYNLKEQVEELVDSLPNKPMPINTISITSTDQVEDIADFGSCRKWSIRTTRNKKQEIDSIPVLNGSIWIKEDLKSAEYLAGYYNALSADFRDSDFDGMELWRVLRKLDLPAAHLKKILDNINGLIVKAEMVCERYSLGRKARITVSTTLSDLLEQKLDRELFEIPGGFERTSGKKTLP